MGGCMVKGISQLYHVIWPIEECAARLEIRASETRAVNSDDAGAGGGCDRSVRMVE